MKKYIKEKSIYPKKSFLKFGGLNEFFYLCEDVWGYSVSIRDFRTGYILCNILIWSIICIKKFCKPTMRNWNSKAPENLFQTVLTVRKMILFILSRVNFVVSRQKNSQVFLLFSIFSFWFLSDWMKVWVRRFCRFPAEFYPCGLSPGENPSYSSIKYNQNPNSFNFHNQNKIS